ncbi:type VII secretion AAA-ATPase EccA [uncultured Clostridium sp.]|nr:type VII secretion AAA-ATPase EccA [uncultured Clostridium sp.]
MTRLYVCDRIVTTMLNDNTRYHPDQWRSVGIRIVNKYKGCMKVDKYEYQAKLEEMKKLVDKEEYEEAVAIADTIEWKRVRSVRTLCLVSEIYEIVGRAEDSKNILYRAYRRSPGSRQILYRLTEACVQTQDFDDAVEYYTEYVNLAPHDNNKYILKYEIYKGRGSSVEEQIQVLEELKSQEYTEQWAYELARLYAQAGMIDKCIAECDDLALWFHNGEYVVQALELKKKYAPLTPEQQTIYDNPSSIVDMETKEAAIEAAVPTLDEEITKELPKSETEVIADSIMMNTEKEIAAAVAEHKEETTQEEQTAEPARPKDFNTVEMQNELANSMRQILSGMRGSKPAAEPEPIPEAAVAATQEEEPEEEQQMEGQMSIDDILTGAAEEPKQSPVSEAAPAAQVEETQPQDILSAETINLSDSIHREIGDRDLRSYATELAARQREAAAVQIPVPEPVKEPVLKDVPVMNKEKKEKQQPVQEEVQDVQPVQETVQNVQPVQEAVQAVEPEKPAEAAEAAEETPVQTAQQEAEPQQPKIDPMSYVRTGLDEKEKSLLGFWSSIRGMNEQVNEVVTLMMRSILTDKTSSHGNVLLIGDAGNGRTTLALGMAKILGRCKGLQSQKVAKIYAEDLNGKDIAATVNKIAGGILIIEEAGDLSDSAAAQLSMAMDFKTDGLIVFLEDERRYLMDLLGRNPQFAQKFDITLNVPTLTNDELVEFGKYYALQNDCVMDDSAVLTLYDGIGVLQNSEQPVAILDVKEIMDKAIKKANKFSLGKLFSTVSGKRYDAEDRIIIKGKYFGKIK